MRRPTDILVGLALIMSACGGGGSAGGGGCVMMQSVHDASVFYRLTPDLSGSYVGGSWSRLSGPPAEPNFGAGDDAGDASAALLPSGHVVVAAL